MSSQVTQKIPNSVIYCIVRVTSTWAFNPIFFAFTGTCCENHHQAREAESTHETWTKTINEKIKLITKTNTNETPNEITLEELNKNIKTLKRGKSTGPDNIPNEAIIEANKTNRTTINNILNNIYNTEKIPDQWQKGEIIKFYKGKGKKGKCSNERGITLGSNMGKLFERIINNRISKVVNISEAQAGGQKGKATADHLLILNTIIQTHKNKNKNEDMYIAFLDVTKAYDKAWLNAIIYALYNSGLTGKDWNILKHINENLTATTRTQYGNTNVTFWGLSYIIDVDGVSYIFGGRGLS